MSNMLKIALFVCIAFSFCKDVKADDITISVRLTEKGIERIIKNESNHTLSLYKDPFTQAEGFLMAQLSSPSRSLSPLGIIAEFREPLPYDLHIESGVTHTNFVTWDRFYRGGYFKYDTEYTKIICSVLPAILNSVVHSAPFYLGFPSEQGQIRPPVVNPVKKDPETILAFIYDHTNNNLELGFLLFNGSTNNVALNAPLINDNRLIVTVPSIAYSNEIFTASTTATNLVVEAGKVGEWRLPWPSVFEQLPLADQALLREAGDVDLVWKAGSFISPVLPLNLKE